MDGARERIINNALALAGREDDRIEILFDVVLSAALACCNREDVPYRMESALTLILADMVKKGGDANVKSMTRGDVSVSYFEGDVKESLVPFVKMRAV